MRTLGVWGYSCSLHSWLWSCTGLHMEPHHRRYAPDDRRRLCGANEQCGHYQNNGLDCRLRWYLAYPCLFYSRQPHGYRWTVERYRRWPNRLRPRCLGCPCSAKGSWLASVCDSVLICMAQSKSHASIRYFYMVYPLNTGEFFDKTLDSFIAPNFSLHIQGNFPFGFIPFHS
jgi:hypothetical protein